MVNTQREIHVEKGWFIDVHNGCGVGRGWTCIPLGGIRYERQHGRYLLGHHYLHPTPISINIFSGTHPPPFSSSPVALINVPSLQWHYHFLKPNILMHPFFIEIDFHALLKKDYNGVDFKIYFQLQISLTSSYRIPIYIISYYFYYFLLFLLFPIISIISYHFYYFLFIISV